MVSLGGVPDEEGPERERQRKQLALFMHCLCCTALSGCYFSDNNKPKKHPKCDCGQISIPKPKKRVKQFVTFENLLNIFSMRNIATKGKTSCLGC